MILTREVNIKINNSNYNYYKNLGLDVDPGEEITIPVELLSKGSQIKITCECDGCGKKKEIIYKNYLKYDIKWGEYYCRKCSEDKRKKSLKENFGVDYPIQSDEILDRIKSTMMERYGVDNYAKLKRGY